MNSAILCLFLATVSIVAVQANHIEIDNESPFVAWLELDYKEGGKPKKITTESFIMGTTASLTVPAGATDVTLSTKYYKLPFVEETVSKEPLTGTFANKCWKLSGVLSPTLATEDC